MSGRLDGRVAIVTGSGRGIGRSIAECFAAEGARVVVNYAARGTEAAEVVDGISAAGGEAIAVQANVAIAADVARLVDATVERFGRVDILVNNAGVTLTPRTKQIATHRFGLRKPHSLAFSPVPASSLLLQNRRWILRPICLTTLQRRQ